MRRLLVLLMLVPFAAPTVDAAEGMWQPHQLPELADELRTAGLEVSPQALNDLTDHPMAAIVSLGGCSASFVSPEGLAVTNHHCVQSSLQYNSTEQRNLLKDGYLAETQAEELPGSPGSRILVTRDVTDVTSAMLKGLTPDMDGLARYRELEAREKHLVAECEREPGYRCSVRSFYEGLEFYLIRQLEIRDVRLVYVPSAAIGVFGGDIDNWMWPRHTGDFSFLRAYVGSDGKPADYAEDNVPFKPEHYLAVSTNGLQPGAFTMAAGYPGRTYRHRLAIEADDVSRWFYPTSRQRFLDMLTIIERETADRPDAAIRYSSLVQGLNNVIKNYGGMIEGFARSGLVNRKTRLQNELAQWLETQPAGANQHSISRLQELIEEYRGGREQRLLYDNFLRRRAALLKAATTLYRLSVESEKPDPERKPGYQERDRNDIRDDMNRLERGFDTEVDKALLAHHLELYTDLKPSSRIASLDRFFGLGDDDIDSDKLRSQLDEMYRQTELDKTEKRLALLDASPEQFRSSKDPFVRLAVALYDSDIERERDADRYAGRFQHARAQYIATLSDWFASLGKPLYPDANSTLRVTYGKVAGYSPRDAVRYEPFTTVRGIIEKHTGETPFDAPASLLAAIEQRHVGAFSDRGTVPVNFLATLDSTGGNSGSAVLDARGELVGLLFDGNYESINADWYFDEKIARTICVDMRYVLWIMDSVDGAHRLLREMGVGPAALHARQVVH